MTRRYGQWSAADWARYRREMRRQPGITAFSWMWISIPVWGMLAATLGLWVHPTLGWAVPVAWWYLLKSLSLRSYKRRFPRWFVPRVPRDYQGWGRKPVEGLTDARWDSIRGQWRGRCAYCATSLTAQTGTHREHVVPLARGGPHHWNNIVPACIACNLAKGVLTGDEFIAHRRRKGRPVNPLWDLLTEPPAKSDVRARARKLRWKR